jgi:hypothetical protein
MSRKFGPVALAASIVLAVISLVFKGGVGLSQTVSSLSDFNITGARVQITQETSTECTNSTDFLSCNTGQSYDTYQVLASLALDRSGNFLSDLDGQIYLTLSSEPCFANATSPVTNSTVIAGSAVTVSVLIPGNQLRQISTPFFKTYSFDGNVPEVEDFGNPNVYYPGSSSVGYVNLDLTVPSIGPATLSVEGSADLCGLSGPLSLTVFLTNPDFSESDSACINVGNPQYITLDISQVVCR